MENRRSSVTAGARSYETRSRRSASDSGNIHPALWIRAGLSLEEVQATLRNLAVGLAVISGAVFLLALALSDALCRRAMRPVTEMANAAHAIQGADLGERLPLPQSGDELQDLGQSFNSLLEPVERVVSPSKIVYRGCVAPASHAGDRHAGTDRPGTQAGSFSRGVPESARPAPEEDASSPPDHRVAPFLARADTEVPQPSVEPIDLAAWLPEHVASWHDPRVAADVRVCGRARQSDLGPSSTGVCSGNCSITYSRMPRNTAIRARRSLSIWHATGRPHEFWSKITALA